MLLVGRMQSIPLLHLPCDMLTLVEVIAIVNLPSRLIHCQGHDVQVMPVYILMLIDHERLIAIAHPLDILQCNGGELFIGESVIGMRVQGDMNNGLFRMNLAWHICQKVLHTIGNIVPTIGRTEHLICFQYPCDAFVYLLSVVCQRPIQGTSIAYFCDHFS